jgi:hypothetical protein
MLRSGLLPLARGDCELASSDMELAIAGRGGERIALRELVEQRARRACAHADCRAFAASCSRFVGAEAGGGSFFRLASTSLNPAIGLGAAIVS